MKKTIFFDLGNVLLFFDHKKMCTQASTLTGVKEERVYELMLGRGDLYERGGIDSCTLHREITEESQRTIEFNALMTALSDIFQPNPPVIELAMRLKAQGHPLFLLSNTCEPHFIFAKTRFPFLSAFDGYVLSYEVQARKPEKKIFESALSIAKCAPSDCFYTDDILSYVESARELHIDAEQYTHPQTLEYHLSSRGFLNT
jgi:FMN phosphatase YigB (HAD superfamily)